MRFLQVLCCFWLAVLLSGPLAAQRPIWRTFDLGDTIHTLADEDDFLWIATRNTGLLKMRKSTGQIAEFGRAFGLRSTYVYDVKLDDVDIVWAATKGGLAVLGGIETLVFHTGNSELPHDEIHALQIGNGNVWLGTWGGLARFDLESWDVYTTDNSDLPDNRIRTVALADSIVWVGTQEGGLAKLDSGEWTIYDTTNSPLAHNSVWTLHADEVGNLWIGTASALQRFDGTNWETFTPENSPIASRWVNGVDRAESTGVTWLATHEGLSAFDGSNWERYDQNNSVLEGLTAEDVMVDETGDVWIGMFTGQLAVYNEDGLNALAPSRIEHQIYPNPFSDQTLLEVLNKTAYEGTYSIYFYDALGREIGRRERFSDRLLYLNQFDFPAGLVVYRLVTEELEIARGKLTVTRALR